MNNIVKESPDLKEILISGFNDLENRLNGEAASELHKIRKDAIKIFQEIGFPTRKNEEWKYTNINPIIKKNYKLPPLEIEKKFTRESLEQYLIPDLNANVVTLINGKYNSELSDIKDNKDKIFIGSVRKAAGTHSEIFEKHYSKYAAYSNDGFTALNTAFSTDGALIYIPKNASIEYPVYILNIFITGEENYIVNPRNLIIAEESGSARIFENYFTGEGSSMIFANEVTEIVVGKNANVEYHKIQNDNDNNYYIGTTQVVQERDSKFHTSSITWGSSIVRNNLNIVLNGVNCESILNGVYFSKGKQLIDNHTFVDHSMPNCYSNELYKGIVDDNSTGIFNGKIMVRKDAQKTNAYQSNQNILLSDNAIIDAKPQLEIFADDVKCSHGATVGQLDKDSMFYLKARGIGEKMAKSLLLYAFVNEVIETIPDEPVKKYLGLILEKKLSSENN
jgi:Fe-S cluster assembly protein SufD